LLSGFSASEISYYYSDSDSDENSQEDEEEEEEEDDEYQNEENSKIPVSNGNKNSSQKFKIIKETILAYIQVVPIYSILSLFENASNNMKMKIIFIQIFF
jgi:hypothetical protein